jgi:predicted amidophosphoribosyltransferase
MPWQLARAIANAGGHKLIKALERQRACLGQHHLNSNLEGVFHCVVPAGQQLQPLLLVDDILTTGATALAAMAALEKAGHGLLGLACIARTPAAKKQEWVG